MTTERLSAKVMRTPGVLGDSRLPEAMILLIVRPAHDGGIIAGSTPSRYPVHGWKESRGMQPRSQAPDWIMRFRSWALEGGLSPRRALLPGPHRSLPGRLGDDWHSPCTLWSLPARHMYRSSHGVQRPGMVLSASARCRLPIDVLTLSFAASTGVH
jgi:hypothetical protein